MPKPLIKSFIDAVLPKGSIWVPKVTGFFEGLLLGVADSFDGIHARLSTLADIRNPQKTTLLDELEIDYGVKFNPALTEQQRRDFLSAFIGSGDNTGSRQELENAIRAAGFDLFVYSNSPAVNPNLFANNFDMTAGDDNAFAGEPDAVAGVFGSDFVVNGDIVIEQPIYLMTAGEDGAFAGEPDAVAEIEDFIETFYQYSLPGNPDSWPFIFFVGGPATFDLDGSILSIEFVEIDDSMRLQLREIILKYKPLITWGLLQVNYV